MCIVILAEGSACGHRLSVPAAPPATGLKSEPRVELTKNLAQPDAFTVQVWSQFDLEKLVTNCCIPPPRHFMVPVWIYDKNDKTLVVSEDLIQSESDPIVDYGQIVIRWRMRDLTCLTIPSCDGTLGRA